IIADLEDHEDEAVEPAEPASDAPAPLPVPPDWHSARVLCVAGRTDLDEAPARILAQLLHGLGLEPQVLPCEAVTVGNLPRLDLAGVRLIWLSYISAQSFTHARYLARRLRRRAPGVPILIGFW